MDGGLKLLVITGISKYTIHNTVQETTPQKWFFFKSGIPYMYLVDNQELTQKASVPDYPQNTGFSF